jgi:hypothetical protein
MDELAREHTYAGIEKRWGPKREAVRKFVENKTAMPHKRSRRRYGEIFLEFHPAGYVLERRSKEEPAAMRPLKAVLPSGEARAEAVIEKLYELAKRHPDEYPEEAEQMKRWLKTLLKAEYSVERRYRGGK